MDWEEKLLAMPVDQWLVKQVVVLDWHDGPRHGLCALTNPAVEFFFDLFDEEYNPDGLNLLIVRLKELPLGSVVQFASELNKLGPGPVNRPVWIPVWKFATADARCHAEELVEALKARARKTDLLISTPDMTEFTGCWGLGTQRPETRAIPEMPLLPNTSANNTK